MILKILLIIKVSPMPVSNHCVAHREALAARHAAEGIPVVTKFLRNLEHLYYFYENSPVGMAALKNIQVITKILIFISCHDYC